MLFKLVCLEHMLTLGLNRGLYCRLSFPLSERTGTEPVNSFVGSLGLLNSFCFGNSITISAIAHFKNVERKCVSSLRIVPCLLCPQLRLMGGGGLCTLLTCSHHAISSLGSPVNTAEVCEWKQQCGWAVSWLKPNKWDALCLLGLVKYAAFSCHSFYAKKGTKRTVFFCSVHWWRAKTGRWHKLCQQLYRFKIHWAIPTAVNVSAL